MFEFVQLTDGTDATACDLTDNVRFALVGYNLQVAVLADSELTSDPYADSVDQVTFHALGCTAAEAYANATAVNALLDQAYRWQRGDAATLVRVQLRTQNSVNLLEGWVKGRAPGGSPNTALPAVWNAYYNRFVIENITIQIRRRGRLLHTVADTASASAQPVPTVTSFTFADHPQVSPARLDFTGAPGSVPVPCIIALTPRVAAGQGQVIMEAEGGVLGSGVTSVDDSANSARGNTIARYTAPASPGATTIALLPSGLSGTTRRLVCVMAVRKNQAATVFDVQVSYRLLGGPTVMASTEVQRISSSNTNPQLLIFDPVSFRDNCNSVLVTITPITVSTGNTFDIDYVAVIGVDDVASAILRLDFASLGANGTISINPLATEPTPRVQEIDSGIPLGLSYSGNPGAFGVRNVISQITLFATGGGAAANRWRMYDTVGAAVANLGLTATRRRAYLIPGG